MAHLQDQIDADTAALAAHRCPECARDLKPMTAISLQAHIDQEFPHGQQFEHQRTDYGRRYRELMAYRAKRFTEVK